MSAGVEHIGPIGTCKDHDVFLRPKSVHFDEELVERRLALVISAKAAALPFPLCFPIASISSMKIMQGAFFFAEAKRSRTREGPTPTNISTNSEPETDKKGRLPHQPSPWLTMSCLYRRPGKDGASRNFGTQLFIASGFLQKLHELHNFLLRLVPSRQHHRI